MTTVKTVNPAHDFSGQVAVVTGAGSGMGLDTARAFATAGAAVVLADINEDALRATDHTQEIMSTTHPLTLVLALLATISLSACGGDDDQVAAAPDASTPAPSPSPSASAGTPIRITFGATELFERLHDNATARDLAAQLPLTLTFRDHNNVEKTAPLPRELSVAGAPEGHDPAAGDIGYWAPDGDLVFYYADDAPFFNGIVRIGEFDGEMDAIERQSEDFTVTIERAR